MKWENKGHEFDRLSERFAPNMKVWIYGGQTWDRTAIQNEFC